MPNKKKYESLKKDPIRWAKYLKQKREWKRNKRVKYPFKVLSYIMLNKHGVKVSPFDFWKIAKRQKLICPISGRRLNGKNISIDHILSLKHGGTNDVSNLQLTDYHANLAKFTLTMDELFVLCQDILNYHNA